MHTQSTRLPSLVGLSRTVEQLAVTVDALAGASPQHHLHDLSDPERDVYERGYRAGYTKAWNKWSAHRLDDQERRLYQRAYRAGEMRAWRKARAYEAA